MKCKSSFNPLHACPGAAAFVVGGGVLTLRRNNRGHALLVPRCSVQYSSQTPGGAARKKRRYNANVASYELLRLKLSFNRFDAMLIFHHANRLSDLAVLSVKVIRDCTG